MNGATCVTALPLPVASCLCPASHAAYFSTGSVMPFNQAVRVALGPQTNTSTAASMYLPLGVDNSWDFQEFSDSFQIKINRMDASSMEFDIIGIDPAIANALRRILIAEVPTVAIEHVFFVNNTSVIQVGDPKTHQWGSIS